MFCFVLFFSLLSRLVYGLGYKDLGSLRPDFYLSFWGEFWNCDEKSIANGRYMSLLLKSNTTISFK